jgi:hypothetical protein
MSALPIMMERTHSGLVPLQSYDAERLEEISYGATVEVTIRQRRSNPNHRHFFVVLSRVVAGGCVPFETVDELLSALKMACGITEIRQGIGGAPYIVPGSISFAAKDEPAFRAFKDRAFALLASHYGINVDDLERAAA